MESSSSSAAAAAARDGRRQEPVAVVGVALRAPGADSVEQFWDNIVAKKHQFVPATDAQLRRAGVRECHIRDRSYCRTKPVLNGPGAFDADFFRVSGREARMMDPSHRLFLTCCWEAMERASIPPGPEAGVVGVYGGAGSGGPGDYMFMNFGGNAVDLSDSSTWLPISLGGSAEHVTSRVCFHLNVRGPNITSLAACATSLVAIHQAVRALEGGECDVALAGGASVSTPNVPGYLSTEGGPLSTSGVLRAFDERADGTVFSSGVGVVVLKRLDDAIRDGHIIHAVVRGTGIFNDGGGDCKSSFAAPTTDGQIAAMSRAFDASGVSADTVEFLETHGTGTLVGDPIEVESSTAVYRRDSQRNQYCALGALKSNIGHALSASGVLAFIKACLAVEHAIIPPNIHCHHPNPVLNLPETPFYLPEDVKPWKASKKHPRRAGVSAFGFGGCNAHVVVEAPPTNVAEERKNAAEDNSQSAAALVLSAHSERALERQIGRLVGYIKEDTSLNICDISHTLMTGRAVFKHRAAIVASTTQDLESVHRGEAPNEKRRVIFVFPGQGSQQIEMGYHLYREDPSYRVEVDKCAELLRPQLGLDIRTILHSKGKDTEEKLKQTRYIQPLLFVVGYALSKCLAAAGVQPDAMLGHSVGELVAASVAGVFSIEDALSIVVLRGRLMQGCEPGSMMTVFLPSEELKDYLDSGLEIAVFNSPTLTVVSGPTESISRMSKHLGECGVEHRLLKTSHGFHSSSMDPILEPLTKAIDLVERGNPKVPFASTVTGRMIDYTEAMCPSYWAKQARLPVLFYQAVETLSSAGDAVWIELGPGTMMSNLIRRQVGGGHVVLSILDNKNEQFVFLRVMSQLWVHGVELTPGALGEQRSRKKITLPTYPFDEEQAYLLDQPPLRTVTKEPDSKANDALLLDKDNDLQRAIISKQWLRVPKWRKGSLREYTPSRNHSWLIFEDRACFGQRIAERLRREGSRVSSVRPGAKFGRLESNVFSVRPGDKDDLVSVMEDINKMVSGQKLDRILHFWQMGDNGNVPNKYETFVNSLDTGFDTMTALVKALHECELHGEVKVTVAVDGLAAVHPQEQTSLKWEKASLIGPCRGAPKEMPKTFVQLVDIEPSDALSGGSLDDCLLAEASEPEPGVIKALRPEGRFVQSFVPLKDAVGGGSLREGGVVFILGGLGGLGLEVATRLFNVASMHIALLTRSRLPPIEEWPKRAQINDRIGIALEKLVALKKRGADLMVVRGDATVKSQLAAALDEVRSRFGAVHGVIHAAGVVKPSLMLEPGKARADEVFETKVKPALVLEELLANDPLDFFVSFSSIASVAPDRGQVDYGSANAMLDALSKRRASASCWSRVTAICWDAWQEVGMAAEAARREASYRPDVTTEPSNTMAENLQMKVCDGSDFGSYQLVPLAIAPPAPGEVQIEVYAAGLSSFDVHTAQQSVEESGDDGAVIGIECSGRISAVGVEVDGFSVGDPVMAVARGAYATLTNVDARMVAPKPSEMSFEEAACVPLAFLAASHALYHCGNLKKGECVLIHSVDGGIGLAALQLAKASGACVLATAESEEEKQFIKKLGVKDVFEFQNGDLTGWIRDQTGGSGVDMILNSPRLDHDSAGLEMLRPLGRFVDFRARAVESVVRFSGLTCTKNISFHIVYVYSLLQGSTSPRLLAQFTKSSKNLSKGTLATGVVHPVPWQDALDSMGQMAKSRGLGKTVLVVRRPSDRTSINVTELEVFARKYKDAIPLSFGLDLLQELLQRDDVPSNIIVSLNPLKQEMGGQVMSSELEAQSVSRRLASAKYRAPSNDTERAIVKIWAQVLAVEPIGVDDNFVELGGDSIGSIMILQKIRKTLGVNLNRDALARFHTPAHLSEAVRCSSG